MKFNNMKYMVMNLGINSNFFFSKSGICHLEITEENNVSLHIIDNYVPSR